MRRAADKEWAGARERGLLAKSEPSRRVEPVRNTTNKGDQPMEAIQRFVGLEVHKDTIVIAVADQGHDGDGARSAEMAS
jgi:hypothetical protein